MSEENKGSLDPKDLSADFSKKLESLMSGIDSVQNSVQDLKTENAQIKSKLESSEHKEKPSERNENYDYLLGADPEKVLEVVQKTAEKIVDNKLSKKDADQKKEDAYKAKCAEWNTKTYSEFPMQDPKFYAEVDAEFDKIEPIGYKPTGEKIMPPDAVYNAATRVVSNRAKRGESFDYQPSTEMLPGGSYASANNQSFEMTAEQRKYANIYGIAEDRAKKRYREFNKHQASNKQNNQNRY